MSFVWHFNLDADFELAHRGYHASALLDAQLAPHRATAAAALMAPGDVLLGQRKGVGRAWCITTQALRAFAAAGITPEPHPPVEVIRRVNHRLFAHTLGGGLPGQRWVTAREDFAPGTLLKRPLAFAGRGQLRVTGPLTEKDEAWIAASFRKDGLIVEPLVTPSVELSVHGFISAEGRFVLGRLCEQTAVGGVYQSMRPSERVGAALQAEPLLRKRAETVAEALFAAGYFGPFGIDAYRYEDGLCELSEINARYTMGFAVGFKDGWGSRDPTART